MNKSVRQGLPVVGDEKKGRLVIWTIEWAFVALLAWSVWRFVYWAWPGTWQWMTKG